MPEINLILRPEAPLDYPQIYAVNNAAFGRLQEAQLVDRLRNSRAFVKDLSLVATSDNKLVGHVLFTLVEVVSGADKNIGLALAPIAVTPSLQGKGIGSALISEGLKRAKDAGYKFILVLGDQNFYSRFGFEPSIKWNIKAPFNAPVSSFMALELQENALKEISGVVKYPHEFTI